MADFGHFSLCLAWLLALAGCVLGFVSGKRGGVDPLGSRVRRTTIAACVCVVSALFGLAASFVLDDYSLQYVWQYSNRDMASIYKVTAIWGGMDGSMLLWCGMVSVFGALLAICSVNYNRKLASWVLGFINSSTLFFLTITVFFTNPFRYIKAPFIPPDGNGLNPLLQNEYMAAHPPLLYLGFTGLAVPYAFCMAALCSGVVTNDWIRLTRRWCLVGWTFLTVGIVLGGHWAYLELGWGGFWAWDPVENASFLPWLTATAFLHSVMVQERRGMLKIWNVVLCVMTYALTVLGTFLTRSGIVQSVHAFASTDVGWAFLTYLAIIIGHAIFMIVLRWRDLRGENTFESAFSRDTFFLFNNLVLLSICFAILWGVLFPVFSEALTGVRQTVGIPFFNAVNVPLFLALIFLMGVGPLLAWRKSSWSQLRRIFLVPFLSSFLIAAILVWAGVLSFYPVLSYSLCFFVVMTILGELHRSMSAHAQGKLELSKVPQVLTHVLKRQRLRYGAYLVHLGVVVAAVSITASMAHKIEKEITLTPGESANVGRFTITLDEFHEIAEPNYQGVAAQTSIRAQGSDEVLDVLHPELRFYTKNKETTTEVALRMGPREDVYVVLAGLDDSGGKAALKIFINPLQIWLWVGALIMAFGGIIVAVPHPKEYKERALLAGQLVKAN